MIQTLSSVKSKLLLFCFFVFSVSVLAQTTLVNYQFNNNLNPDAGALGNPSLTYYNGANNAIATPNYDNNRIHLVSKEEGNYLELNINSTGYQNLIVSWRGQYSGALLGSAQWTLQTFDGTNWVTSATMDLSPDFFQNNSDKTINVQLPVSYNNNPTSKIRIKATVIGDGLFFDANTYLDNLKITSGAPNITVYKDTANNDQAIIPDNSTASETYNTVFGNLQTLSAGDTKTYRIRNWKGTPGTTLNASDIRIEPHSGTTPQDFTISAKSTNISTIPVVTEYTGGFFGLQPTEYGDFTIRFTPQAEGIRSATVRIYSNGVPSPYSFDVIGGGRSCNILNTTYVQNSIDGNTQALPSDLTISDFIGGNSNSPTPAIFTTLHPANNNLFSSTPSSWYTKDAEKTRTFGSIDISQLRNVSIEFNVAAFGNGNNSNGVTSTDYIILSIQDIDGQWYDAMQLKGSNNNTKIPYAFNSGSVFSATYNKSLTTVNNSKSFPGSVYTSFKLTIPLSISSQMTGLKFRIKAKANTNAVWLIDDVKVVSDNADFKVWNGTNWDNNRPNANQKAVFTGDYNFTGTEQNTDLSVCACEINNGASLTIPAGRTLTVRSKVVNNGSADNVVIQNDGNLIQIEDAAVNEGSVTVQRNTQLANPTNKYLFWSSPVQDQDMYKMFNSGTPQYVMSYNTATDYYTTLAKPALSVAGKGYSVKTPNAGGVSFKGVPNNGAITLALDNIVNSDGNTYNLVGNPYPSNMNLVEFYKYNSTAVDPTFYFWNNVTANTTIQTGAGATTWAVFNASGSGTWSEADEISSITTTSKSVRPGQAFLVKALGTELKFKNNPLRVSGDASTVNRTAATSGDSDGKYWLQFTTPSGLPYSMAVTYGEGASSKFDAFDSEDFSADNSIYSTLEDYHLAIQGRDDFNADDIVPFGLSSSESGLFTIHLSGTEGVFDKDNTTIILKDKATGIETDLSQNDYTFDGEAGITEGRFEIIYKQSAVLDTETPIKIPNLLVYRNGENFIVESPEIVKQISIFEMSGRAIQELHPEQKHIEINIPGNGMFLLKIQTKEGRIYNKKVIK